MTGEGVAGEGRQALRAVGAASFVAIAGVMPVFLVGAVAVLIRAELGFSEARLGLAISAFWGVAALFSIPGGAIVERLGDRGALVLGVLVSGISMLVLASAWSWWGVFFGLALAGLANAVSQLAANLRLAGAVPIRRQGLGFGIKQSANPIATFFGGLAVPVVALTVGWRWVFALGLLLSLTTMLVLGKGRPRNVTKRIRGGVRPVIARRPLVLLGVAIAFGSAAVTAMSAFLVEYAVFVGVQPGRAGLILAIGSLAAIAVRIGSGWNADRKEGGSLILVTGMLLVGGVAYAAFPSVTTFGPILLVSITAYAAAWGWPGLFNLAIVRGNRHAPAAATGVTQVGAYVGGVSGPFAFGLLVSQYGYTTAWWSASASLFIAAVLMVAGRIKARRVWQAAAVATPDGPSPQARHEVQAVSEGTDAGRAGRRTSMDDQRFDGLAATWDDDPSKVERAAAVAEAIDQQLRLAPSTRVFEYGAGTGLLSQHLQHRVGAVTLADRSPGMLEVLRAKVDRGVIADARVLDLDLSEGPVPEGRFDLIATLMALHHIEDVRPVLRGFSTLLEAGGELCIIDVDGEDPAYDPADFGGHAGLSRAKLTDQLEETGFTDVRFEPCYRMRRSNGNEYDLFLAIGRRPATT